MKNKVLFKYERTRFPLQLVVLVALGEWFGYRWVCLKTLSSFQRQWFGPQSQERTGPERANLTVACQREAQFKKFKFQMFILKMKMFVHSSHHFIFC